MREPDKKQVDKNKTRRRKDKREEEHSFVPPELAHKMPYRKV